MTSFWTVWRIYLKLNEEGLDFRWTFKANHVVCFKETCPELHRESMETVYLHSARVLGQHSDCAALTCLVVQLLPWQLCVCRLHFPANAIRQHLLLEHGSLWLVEREAECSGNTQVDNYPWGRAKLWMLPLAWGGGGARQFRHSVRESAIPTPLSCFTPLSHAYSVGQTLSTYVFTAETALWRTQAKTISNIEYCGSNEGTIQRKSGLKRRPSSVTRWRTELCLLPLPWNTAE